MSEDKITIKTVGGYYSKDVVKTPAISFECIFAVLTEIYSQANQIGWETKVLDVFGDWLRPLYEQATKDKP